MRILLAALLLLTASCASASQARLGDLRIVNDAVEPLAFTAEWQTADGNHGYVRGYLPGRGTDTVVANDAVPPGTVIRFASFGPGFQEILRNTVIFEVRPGAVRGSGSSADAAAILEYYLGGEEQELTLIEAPQATWEYPGGSRSVRVSSPAAGKLAVD